MQVGFTVNLNILNEMQQVVLLIVLYKTAAIQLITLCLCVHVDIFA